jgi:hypothetical protein
MTVFAFAATNHTMQSDNPAFYEPSNTFSAVARGKNRTRGEPPN